MGKFKHWVKHHYHGHEHHDGHGHHEGHGHHGWLKGDKKGKKCFKKMQKVKYLMDKYNVQDDTSASNIWSLCNHLLKTLTDIDILGCGHLYHRQCLKQLFTISLTASEAEPDQQKVCCTKCQAQIASDLMDQFKVSLDIQQTGGLYPRLDANVDGQNNGNEQMATE